MTVRPSEGAFRYTYFTDKYEETCAFYRSLLGFELMHAWDRGEDDKGSLFKAGRGLIEVLKRPDSDDHVHEGLDYRTPQGVFMGIQVWEIDDLFERLRAAGVSFKEKVTDQPWGHRSCSALEPNGLVLFFFQEQF